jgi:Succinylglutamate desuccinylase / Aspartoacylase family
VGRLPIRRFDPVRERIPERVEDFLRALGGPAWIEVPGRARGAARAVSTLIHGNEPSGVRAVHAWLRSRARPARDAVFLVASVEAALAPPGFAHRSLPGLADLNRCFLGPFPGRQGELAREALARLRAARPAALIDLHNNTGHNPAYGVAPRRDATLLGLTALFGKHFVHSDLRLGALVEATSAEFPSVTIECGRAGDPAADAVARAGLARYLGDDSLPGGVEGPPMEVLEHPVRVTLRRGGSVGFAERPLPDVDLTVAGDIDRHNFERVAVGTAIGWLRPGAWPLEAREAGGRDLAAELFEARDGQLRTRRELVPIMMTTDAAVARADCLFYVVRPASSPPSSAGSSGAGSAPSTSGSRSSSQSMRQAGPSQSSNCPCRAARSTRSSSTPESSSVTGMVSSRNLTARASSAAGAPSSR